MGAFASSLASLGGLGNDLASARQANSTQAQKDALAQFTTKLTELKLRQLQQQLTLPQYEGTTATPGGGLAAISLHPETGAVTLNPLQGGLTPETAKNRIMQMTVAVSPQDAKVLNSLLSRLDDPATDPKVILDKAESFFQSAVQKDRAPKVEPDTNSIYDPDTNTRYGLNDPKLPPNLQGLRDAFLAKPGSEKAYNAETELHKLHPDWSPEKILAATQRPSFPRIAPVNDAKGNTVGWTYFQGTPGGGVGAKFVSAGSVAGMPTAEGGGIPPKPTSTTLTMAQMASSVLPEAKRVTDEIDTMAPTLGPLVGRWNEVMTGRVGANNPAVAHLQTDLTLLASAIVRTHFGARGGQQYLKDMENYFRMAQSPDDLKARIAAADEWLTNYSGMAGNAGAAPATAAPSANSAPRVITIR